MGYAAFLVEGRPGTTRGPSGTGGRSPPMIAVLVSTKSSRPRPPGSGSSIRSKDPYDRDEIREKPRPAWLSTNRPKGICSLYPIPQGQHRWQTQPGFRCTHSQYLVSAFVIKGAPR